VEVKGRWRKWEDKKAGVNGFERTGERKKKGKSITGREIVIKRKRKWKRMIRRNPKRVFRRRMEFCINGCESKRRSKTQVFSVAGKLFEKYLKSGVSVEDRESLTFVPLEKGVSTAGSL
jgi:hypothetical protein